MSDYDAVHRRIAELRRQQGQLTADLAWRQRYLAGDQEATEQMAGLLQQLAGANAVLADDASLSSRTLVAAGFALW